MSIEEYIFTNAKKKKKKSKHFSYATFTHMSLFLR